jgi:CRP-like cAMP-binding protein
MLARDITVEQFRKNEIIYNELDRPGKMMFLIQGKVKIYKDGISGRNQIVRVIKPIGIFGYRAFFAGEDYKTAAMAFEASLVAFVPMTVIVELMQRNFNVTNFIVRHLAIELGQSDDRTINLTQKHIRGRLAEALLFLRDSYGLEEDGCTLSIYLSREDLANMSNMTTSNAIRTLSSFANEKLLAIDGRKIKLIKIEELEDISRKG